MQDADKGLNHRAWSFFFVSSLYTTGKEHGHGMSAKKRHIKYTPIRHMDHTSAVMKEEGTSEIDMRF